VAHQLGVVTDHRAGVHGLLEGGDLRVVDEGESTRVIARGDATNV
jgi:hypothetical protein